MEQNCFSDTGAKILTKETAGWSHFLEALFSEGAENLWEQLTLKKVFSASPPLARQLLALLVPRYKCREGTVSKVTPMKSSPAGWLVARARNHLVRLCSELDICYHCSLQLFLIDLLHINGMKGFCCVVVSFVVLVCLFFALFKALISKLKINWSADNVMVQLSVIHKHVCPGRKWLELKRVPQLPTPCVFHGRASTFENIKYMRDVQHLPVYFDSSVSSN